MVMLIEMVKEPFKKRIKSTKKTKKITTFI